MKTLILVVVLMAAFVGCKDGQSISVDVRYNNPDQAQRQRNRQQKQTHAPLYKPQPKHRPNPAHTAMSRY